MIMASSSTAIAPKSQGKKWSFIKNGTVVNAVYATSRSIIKSPNGDDFGKVIALESCENNEPKVLVKFSSMKKLRLSLELFTGIDDPSKRLLLAISDNTDTFVKATGRIYGVEATTSENLKTPTGKRRQPTTEESSKKKKKKQAAIEPSTHPSTHTPSNSSSLNEGDSVSSGGPIENEPSISEDDTSLYYPKTYLINQDNAPHKVLVSCLKAPRPEFNLRDVDDIFVNALVKEMKDNGSAISRKPLLAVVKDVKSPDQFNVQLIDSYELEVIGGNHRRAALQRILQESNNDEFKFTEAILLCEMPKDVALKLASCDNRMDNFHHNVTTQDKIKLFHKILNDDFKGKKDKNWKTYCSKIMDSGKKELFEFEFLLSGLQGNSYKELMGVFATFEMYKVKDQVSSVGHAKKLVSGSLQKPSITASKFKCLRGLSSPALTELLSSVGNAQLSFLEMKSRATEIKGLVLLQTEFLKLSGEKSWSNVQERFPESTSDDILKPFLSSIQRGKVDASFTEFVLKTIKMSEITTKGTTVPLQTIAGTTKWFSGIFSQDMQIMSKLFEQLPFCGADLIVVQNKELTGDILKKLMRQICALNARIGKEKFVIILRNQMYKDVDVDMSMMNDASQDILYVGYPKNPKKGPTLTNATEIIHFFNVGNVQLQATNIVMVENEIDMWHEVLDIFCPINGTILEIDDCEGQFKLLDAMSETQKISMVSVFRSKVTADRFNARVTQHLENNPQLTLQEDCISDTESGDVEQE